MAYEDDVPKILIGKHSLVIGRRALREGDVGIADSKDARECGMYDADEQKIKQRRHNADAIRDERPLS